MIAYIRVATPTPTPEVTSKPSENQTVTSKQTSTPKPTPTEAPKSTGTVTLDPVVENGVKGTYVNGSFVPSYSGTYIDGYLVLDGLEEYTGEIPTPILILGAYINSNSRLPIFQKKKFEIHDALICNFQENMI